MDKLITQSLDLAAVHFPPSVTVYLQPRDIIGEGIHFHGSPLSATAHVAPPREIQPADRFEVVRLLSVQTGSPSPVHTYLVRELLPPETIVESSSQAVSGPVRPTYGGEFAVKFLVKADLVRTATRRRDSTLSGIHVHRTLPTHRNIATLYRTYENETVLVLVMEHVSGANNTSQLFPVRSRDCVTSAHAHIVASAFSQMCDAVATCHEAGAFFQDILLHDFTFSFFYTVVRLRVGCGRGCRRCQAQGIRVVQNR
ncbi:hypothetical protein BV25DRAFT_1552424 [Artomyces pyxidatus]|uniref:Uncharacterized protein n=1 Tax=Artomyces pyxidatus TaxID=48021 RepID=A0ACB8SK86_9AGAM|nr:hypothetical protein BV25DRAFT_1552424 [Artomyces pyxidatus]